MADWIESHQDLRTNPKAKRLARLLDVPLAQAIGHLHMLWWWAIDHADRDGEVTRFDAYDIADAAGWHGDEEAFLQALIDCGPGGKHGFLERADDGSTRLHDWPEYTMALYASREGAAYGNHERWHTKRGITDPSCRFCASPPDSPPTSPPSRPPNPTRVAPDVPPESGSESTSAREESTDLPTYRPTKGRARETTQDEPERTPHDEHPNGRPTPARWDHAWARIARYVNRYGQHDDDRPPLELDPRSDAALRALGGLTAVRRDEANRFDFRDAWNALAQEHAHG